MNITIFLHNKNSADNKRFGLSTTNTLEKKLKKQTILHSTQLN